MEHLGTLQQILLWCTLLACALTDAWKGLIYNWLTLPAIIVGMSLAISLNGLSGLAFSLSGVLIGGGIFVIGFCFGILGGGDVKLMAAIGAITGPIFVAETIFASILVGGIVAFCLLLFKGGLLQTFSWYYKSLKALFFRIRYKGGEFTSPKNPHSGTFSFGICIFVVAVFAYYYDLIDLIIR